MASTASHDRLIFHLSPLVGEFFVGRLVPETEDGGEAPGENSLLLGRSDVGSFRALRAHGFQLRFDCVAAGNAVEQFLQIRMSC